VRIPFVPLGEPALAKARSDLGRGGYTPGVFPKSAQVVWGEWVANLLILGVRRLFGMRGMDGGSSCDCGGSSNLRLLNTGNDNTNGIGCQVVKAEKGKGKREGGEVDGGWFEWAWLCLGWWQAKPTVETAGDLGGRIETWKPGLWSKSLRSKRGFGSCEI